MGGQPFWHHMHQGPPSPTQSPMSGPMNGQPMGAMMALGSPARGGEPPPGNPAANNYGGIRPTDAPPPMAIATGPGAGMGM